MNILNLKLISLINFIILFEQFIMNIKIYKYEYSEEFHGHGLGIMITMFKSHLLVYRNEHKFNLQSIGTFYISDGGPRSLYMHA